MEKRERLERTLAGEPTDRAPVAMWRAFAGDDQRAADYAQSVSEFQFAFDWDVCVLVPPWPFAAADYGLSSAWHGAPDGEHVVQRRAIKRSLDWTDLRLPDPTRGEFGKLGTTARVVADSMKQPEIPVVVGVLSPLAQAARLVGDDVLVRHLRTQPDRLLSGLNVLTDATVRFLDSLRAAPLAGVYLMVEHADYAVLSEAEYVTFGLPGDHAVLAQLPRAMWLRMAYFRGSAPMVRQASALGATLLGWDDRATELDLQAAKGVWDGAFFGGLDPEKHLRAGAPASIRDAARDALSVMGGRRLMVGAGAPGLLTTPRSHWRAARLSVERQG
ncbi:MAG: hypothetical protein MUC99_12080 [Anaerolineae bacterium]|nr:hypothetical protein [Anaerolineae bacterium]